VARQKEKKSLGNTRPKKNDKNKIGGVASTAGKNRLDPRGMRTSRNPPDEGAIPKEES